MAYEILSNESGVTVEWFEQIGRLSDFIAVILVGNGRVGFANRGDMPKLLRQYLARLKAESCAVIVCATRSKGDTQTAVTELQPPYSVEFLYQQAYDEPDRQRENRAIAKQIVRKVKDALGA